MGLETKHFKTSGECLTYLEAGRGDVVHIAHANGFSAGVYEPMLLELAKERRVLGLNICGQCACDEKVCPKAPRRISSWRQLAREMRVFLEKESGGRRITGVGHSIGGAATLICAVEAPRLFKKIILLDPVLLEPGLVRFIAFMNLIGQRHRAPLAVRARKRKSSWGSREEAFEYFRDRPLFGGWPEESLAAYVKYGVKDSASGGVELACPPEMEAQGFSSYPTDIWRRVRKLRVPVFLVRGGESDTLTTRARDLFMKHLPGATLIEIPGAGHLFPMQLPYETANIIRDL